MRSLFPENNVSTIDAIYRDESKLIKDKLVLILHEVVRPWGFPNSFLCASPHLNIIYRKKDYILVIC